MSKDSRLSMSVCELNLPIRITNRLQEYGVDTVEELLYKQPKDILQIPQLGEKALDAIYIALEKIGFYRKGREPREQAAA